MFFGAAPILFERARELRKNLTKAEKLMWSQLSKKQLGVKFRRQHPIDQYIADFYCHELRLVIEVDGEIHNEPDIFENDRNRDSVMKDLGINVLRFSNSQIINSITEVRYIVLESIRNIKPL